jgi:mannose-6-phosphate isomerase-like protein (cupin superfamily)
MLEKLIEAAKNEDWEYVDKHLPAFCNNYRAYRWGSKEINSGNDPHLVDLAASILAETSHAVTAADKKALLKVLKQNEETWEFARFRSACALVIHGSAEAQAIDILLDFTRHEEVELRPVANRCLSILSKKDIQNYCKQVGYATETGFDEPDYRYKAHFHERTILKTIEGSIQIYLDVGEINLQPGNYVLVREGETHAAHVGPEGWKFFAAYSPEDSKKYPGRH